MGEETHETDLFDSSGTKTTRRATNEADILPLHLYDAEPLRSEDLATHVRPLEEALHGYDIFQKTENVCIMVLLTP